MRLLSRVLPSILLGLIWVYQKILSPTMPPRCRFQPTCSTYAKEAITLHGGLMGTWLAIRRVARCHPLGGSGYDPVPPIKDETPDRQTKAPHCGCSEDQT